MTELTEMFLNPDVNDKDIIIHILENGAQGDNITPITILGKVQEYTEELLRCCYQYLQISRPLINRILLFMQEINQHDSGTEERYNVIVKYSNFDDEDTDNAIDMFMFVMCKAIWELEFKKKVMYKDPRYVLAINKHPIPYLIFVNAVKNKHASFINESLMEDLEKASSNA